MYVVYIFDVMILIVCELFYGVKIFRGDFDNYLKFICDVLNGVVWDDDG